ncbi:hypothetical protein BH11BAC6_BH11BAC6_15690 [soil metagenome]
MKKIIMALSVITVFALASINANAQQVTASAGNNDLKIDYVSLNKDAAKATESKTSLMNERALKGFKKSYKSAANASWYKTDDGAYIASFTEGNVKTAVTYDNKGRWLYSIKRYFESDLPKDVRNRIKSVYYDFSITCVDEVSINNEIIYCVHLEDATSFKMIRVTDDDMQEIQAFIKG